jgi:hypothetical protein
LLEGSGVSVPSAIPQTVLLPQGGRRHTIHSYFAAAR